MDGVTERRDAAENPGRPDQARNVKSRRRYAEIKNGTLKISTATPGELHRALDWAERINDFEMAAKLEMALDV